MKTIVIPDIHTKIDVVDLVLANESYDQVVLLGDYFDNFDDTPEDNERTAKWLNEKVADNKFVCLMGNHDQSYFCNPVFVCNKFTFAKQIAILSAIKSTAVGTLVPMVWTQGWLLTHAGLTASLFKKYGPNLDQTVQQHYRETFSKNIWPSGMPELFAVGRARGGSKPVGGITWCDFDVEFEPTNGVKQIFGHTRSSDVRYKGNSVCLDTGLRHYGVIEDGELIVKSTGWDGNG